MPLAPNQQSETLLWAESNQREKVPSDVTEPPRGIWIALGKAMWAHLLERLLGIEMQKKNYQVRAMDMEKLGNL